MPDDLARIIARILDGQRPAPTSARGRPLQQFVAGAETVRLQTETSSAVTSAVGSPRYGSAKYGLCIYGE